MILNFLVDLAKRVFQLLNMAPTETPDQRKALFREIQGARQRNAKELGNSYFLTTEDLVQILTHEKIASLLKEAYRKDFSHEYVESIIQTSLKTLAILVRIRAVQNFVALFESFNDSCLPITVIDSSSCQVATLHLEVDKFGHRRQRQYQCEVFESWDEEDVEYFEKSQWLFLPVEFSYDTFLQAAHPEQPLPVRSADFPRRGGGHFSDVYEVDLPIAHGPNASGGASSSFAFHRLSHNTNSLLLAQQAGTRGHQEVPHECQRLLLPGVSELGADTFYRASTSDNPHHHIRTWR